MKSKIDKHSKEIEDVAEMINQTDEKISYLRSEVNIKQDDLFENLNSQIKELHYSFTNFNENTEKTKEEHFTKIEEINKSFVLRLEALSKTVMNENKALNEKIYKNEKDFDLHQREMKHILNNVERGLFMQDEKLKLSLNSKYL